MSKANVEVVKQFEDAFICGDMDHVLSLLSPDVVVHEAPSLPYPGDHRGHDGFLKLADAFNSVWEIVSELDLTFLDGGDTKVIVLVAFDAVARTTGVRLRVPHVEIYTVIDGKIVDLDVYYRDTAAIVEATGGARML
jgi:ketosteroid isomerase-like protein